MLQAIVLGLIAGIMIPAGGMLARIEHFRPRWLETEVRHLVMAFGGGVLIAAVALVLVPEATDLLPGALLLPAFILGGIAFGLLDRAIQHRSGPAGQFLAMVADFLPETVALGAFVAAGEPAAFLLALLIGVQNLPEGFNAYREARKAGQPPARILRRFLALAALGPLAAVAGVAFLAETPALLGALMSFAAGGILYLVFEDIAPHVPLRNRWFPPVGAVAGFGLGLAGELVLG